MKTETQTLTITENYKGEQLSTPIELRYSTFGEGSKALVILPGISLGHVTETASAVARAFSRLTETHRIYLFDRKEYIEAGYDVRNMADDMAAAFRQLRLAKADIYGASQGGMLAMSLAIKYPELVNRLVVASTSPKVDDHFKQISYNWIEMAKNGDTKALTGNFIDLMYSDEFIKRYRRLLVSANSRRSDEELANFVRICEASIDFDILDELSQLKAPMLVIGCEGDKVLGGEASRTIAKATGAQLYMYGPEYGHSVYDEAPDYLDHLVRFFDTESK